MGAAKVRKKNGTYPTVEQIATMELQRLRSDPDEPFILTPADLKLSDVPERTRESVRAFLAPFLPNIPVKNCDCWNIAQNLMMLANNPRVAYVEGVWTRVEHHREHEPERGDCDCKDYGERAMFGAPHAWNIVDGHLVDLSAENKFRNWKPEYAEWDPLDGWWHEEFKAYTLDDIKKYSVERYEPDGLSITVPICLEGYGEDYGIAFTQEDAERAQRAAGSYEKHIFQSASDRLQARYLRSVRESVAA